MVPATKSNINKYQMINCEKLTDINIAITKEEIEENDVPHL